MKRFTTWEPVNRNVPQPMYRIDLITISLAVEVKKVVPWIDFMSKAVNPIISITTAPCNINETSCSITAPLLCLFPTDVANIIGEITNKNKNSICLRANIIPLKKSAYKKNPPTIIAIIQLILYLYSFSSGNMKCASVTNLSLYIFFLVNVSFCIAFA